MSTRLHRIFSRRTLGWSLYTLAAFGACFLLTFPYESLQARLLSEVSGRTGLEVRAEDWDLAGPLGFVWTGVSVTGPDLPRFGADRVAVEAEFLPFLQGQIRLNGHARLASAHGGPGGTITSHLALEGWSGKGPGRLTGTIEQVSLSDLPLPLTKQGILQVTFDQRWKEFEGPDRLKRVWQGQGTWQVEVNGLELEQVPIGPLFLPSVVLARLKTQLRCQDGICKIEGLQGQGPDGMLNGDGVLTLRSPFADSRLVFSLSLTVSEAYKRRVPIAALLPGLPGTPVIVTLSGSLSRLQVAL